MDGRKPPIRGLGERNGKFIARIAVKDSDGTKRTRWVTLKGAATVPRPQEGLKELRVQRTRNKLPVLKRTPKLAGDLAEYLAYFDAVKGAKRPAMIQMERGAPTCQKPSPFRGRSWIIQPDSNTAGGSTGCWWKWTTSPPSCCRWWPESPGRCSKRRRARKLFAVQSP
jgi:hypothetical protein